MKAFKIVGPYTLSVTFGDDPVQVINFLPILYGEVFGPLRDLPLFNQVRLDPEVYTLVWPNGADFDLWLLLEWPRLVKSLTARAQTWAEDTEGASILQNQPA